MGWQYVTKKETPAMVELDKKFWKTFAGKHWEKSELHVKGLKAPITEISEADVFKMLVQYADQCRKLKDPAGFKFFIHGYKASEADVLQVLPTKKDQNLLGYHARMKELFKDYCLVCDGLLDVSSNYQKALQSFTQGLYQAVGFPNRFTEVGLYLGNYKKTPFGVHVDSCGVFSFPVAGIKKFRLWSPEYIEKNPSLNRAHSYAKHKAQSKLLVAKPGDMTYWPSSAWHIAESSGEFSATWSLGVWVDRSHKKVIADVINEFLMAQTFKHTAEVTTPFAQLHSDQGEISNLPASYADSLKQILSIKHSDLENVFKSQWMQHISSYGFKTNPASDLIVDSKSRLSLLELTKPILWTRQTKAKRKIYAFAGCLFNESLSSGFHQMILALNQGETVSVADFIKPQDLKREILALQSLAKLGAFQN